MAQKHDLQYLNLVKHTLEHGVAKTDRTDTGTISTNSQQMRFDLSDWSIPLLTTKKMFSRGIIEELRWFFRGETNIQPLLDVDVHIWDEWADARGNLGPLYGEMWRAWPDTQVVYDEDEARELETRGYLRIVDIDSIRVLRKEIDQLAEAIHLLKTSPDSRRIVVNSWNPALLPIDLKVPKNNPPLGLQALPPCHCMFQFTVLDGKLNCDLRQRSADIGLGVPFNIAQYSIMTLLIAKMVGLEPGEFVWNGVDCHIYSNHVDQLKLQLTRLDQEVPDSPTVRISDRVRDILPEQVEMGDIEIVGYTTPYPKLEMGVAT